jgi:hypothetical protein
MRLERGSGYVLLIGGPVPRGADAITLGRLISIRRGSEHSPYLLRHELVHVQQWHRLGVVPFGVRYLGTYGIWRLRRKGHAGAYRRIPLEIQADWAARRSLGAGVVEPSAAARR